MRKPGERDLGEQPLNKSGVNAYARMYFSPIRDKKYPCELFALHVREKE